MFAIVLNSFTLLILAIDSLPPDVVADSAKELANRLATLYSVLTEIVQSFLQILRFFADPFLWWVADVIFFDVTACNPVFFLKLRDKDPN